MSHRVSFKVVSTEGIEVGDWVTVADSGSFNAEFFGLTEAGVPARCAVLACSPQQTTTDQSSKEKKAR